MYIVIVSSIAACLLTYAQRFKFKKAMFFAFFLIGIISCIRCDYGSDYPSYYKIFHNIVTYPFDLDNLFDQTEPPGWILLCYLFEPIGFFGFIAALSVFQIIVYYKLIKNYVPLKMRWIAVVIYLFNPTIWLLQLSMMSQGLAISLFLLAFPYIEQKRWKTALIILLIASYVHMSALILLPFTFIGLLKVQYQKIIAFILIIAAFAMFFSSSVLYSVFGSVLQLAQFQYYEEYYGAQNDENVSFGLGFLMQIIPFVAAIVLMIKNKFNHTFFIATIIYFMALVILPITKIIPLTVRVTYYFEVFSIITMPYIISTLKNKSVKLLVVFVFFVMMVVNYRDFFSVGSVYRDSYIKYTTIFDTKVSSKYK